MSEKNSQKDKILNKILTLNPFCLKSFRKDQMLWTRRQTFTLIFRASLFTVVLSLYSAVLDIYYCELIG